MRSTSRLLLVALLLVGMVSPALAQQEPSRLAVEVHGSDSFPKVTLAVTLPAELLGERLEPPLFSIAENGAEAEVVSVEAEATGQQPQDVVLLIDTSGSMQGAPLTDAKAAARTFLQGMSDSDRVALVAFAIEPVVVSDFTTDRAALVAAIDGLEAAGETAVHDAVVAASRLLRDTDRQVTFILLSDGGDTVSINSFDNAVNAVKATGAPVFAVALESDEWDPQALQILASASGGRYLGVADSAELTSLYQGIARELRNRYLITYRSAGPNTKDLDVEVSARLDGEVVSGEIAFANPLYREIEPESEPPLVFMRLAPWRSGVTIALVFLAMTGFVWALGTMLVRPTVRLQRVEFYDQTRSKSPEEVDLGASGGLRGHLVEAVGYVAGRRGFTKLLHGKLEQAGLPLRPTEYIYLHVVFVLVTGLVIGALSGSIIVAIVTVFIAVFVPIMLLENAIERRRAQFEEQLPELLNLISGSLRAGWGMLQAVGLVVEQMPAPTSTEFRRIETEARLGLSVEEALEGMADRLQSDDFRWTVTAINIQREVGGNLAEVLDIVASTMRARAELKRHIRALTAEGRLSGIILISLPIVELGLLLLVNPRYMSGMLSHPFGWFLAVGGVVLLIFGGVWLRRAMMVEV
ncbi:MAG: VWA domain-containing protein [Coriobacteriia bacterium]|nr:VWA domain-containing protein [Coriobacteriia bacterium]MBN2821962.1 VWA domain-containing protein [Coriobacteriia bacterium]